MIKLPPIRKTMSGQLIEGLVDEYEQMDVLEDRREYSVEDFMSSERVTKDIAERIQYAVHKRMGLLEFYKGPF